MPNRVADHYERHARGVDRERTQSGFTERPWIERFVMPLPRGGAILDLGCGGGEPIARFLVDHGFKVTGVDSSEAMIGLARTRFPRHRWLRIDMRKLTIDDRFDGVIAWGSLFHVPRDEQEAMIARIASWLRPGGRLLFNAGPASGVAIGEIGGETGETGSGPLFHASLDPAEYRAAFANAGLIEMAHAAENPACGGATVWLARKS